MKASGLIFLASAVLAPTFAGPVWSDALPVVRRDDAIRPLLDAWCKARQAPYDDPRARIRLDFSDWREVASADLTALFPGHRFAHVFWDEVQLPKVRRYIPGLAVGEQVTLAVNSTTTRVIELHPYGNYEGFGQLLADGAVSIQTQDDAKKIWTAFCTLHDKEWNDQAIVRVDATTWHLGVVEIEAVRYYYSIKLADDGRVTAGKLHADQIAKR